MVVVIVQVAMSAQCTGPPVEDWRYLAPVTVVSPALLLGLGGSSDKLLDAGQVGELTGSLGAEKVVGCFQRDQVFHDS